MQQGEIMESSPISISYILKNNQLKNNQKRLDLAKFNLIFPTELVNDIFELIRD